MTPGGPCQPLPCWDSEILCRGWRTTGIHGSRGRCHPCHPFPAQPPLPWRAGMPPARPPQGTLAGGTGQTSCLGQRGLCPPTVIANVQFGIASPLLGPRAARHPEATDVTRGTCCRRSDSLRLRTLPASPGGRRPSSHQAGEQEPTRRSRGPFGAVGAVEAGIKLSEEGRSAGLLSWAPVILQTEGRDRAGGWARSLGTR